MTNYQEGLSGDGSCFKGFGTNSTYRGIPRSEKPIAAVAGTGSWPEQHVLSFPIEVSMEA